LRRTGLSVKYCFHFSYSDTCETGWLKSPEHYGLCPSNEKEAGLNIYQQIVPGRSSFCKNFDLIERFRAPYWHSVLGKCSFFASNVSRNSLCDIFLVSRDLIWIY
jgi:hypothetical protein